ncbi:MAG: DUF4169 family protein [Pseudomonadota bacterium]
MADKPINLRRARKVQARKAARADAEAKARVHGQSKAVQSLEAARRAKAAAALEGHRRDGSGDDGPGNDD